MSAEIPSSALHRNSRGKLSFGESTGRALHATQSQDHQIIGPKRYAWREPRDIAQHLLPGQVAITTVSEIPSAGTFREYHENKYKKLHGHRDPETGLYIPGNPDEAYPLTIGYAEGGIVTASNHPYFDIGQIVSSDVTFKTALKANAGDNPNLLWTPHPDLHPSLAPVPRKLLPIVGSAILHAADMLGDWNMNEDDIRSVVSRSRFLVNGAGPLGLLTGKWLQEMGAEDLTVAEVNPARIELAKRIGLDVHNPRAKEFSANKGFATYLKKERMPKRDGHPKDERYGGGPEVVIEFSGAPNVIPDLWDYVQEKGVVVLAGMIPTGTVLDNTFQFHVDAPPLIPAQVGKPPRRQDEAWNKRDRMSGFGETFLLAHDPYTEFGTYGDTVRSEVLRHFAPWSLAPELYGPIMENRADMLREWAIDPSLETTGYVLLYNDALPSHITAAFHPDAPYPSKTPQIEPIIIKGPELKIEEKHVLEMANGYKAAFIEGNMHVENKHGEIMFSNAAGSIELGDGRSISTKDAKITKEGNSIVMEVRGIANQPDMRVSITADKEQPTLRIKQEITNTTESEISIDKFVQLDMQEGLHGVSTDEEVASSIGYMSWAKPEHRKVKFLDVQDDFRYIPQVYDKRVMTHGEKGGQILSEAVHVQADSGQQMLIGNLPTGTQSRHQGIIEMHNEDSRIVAWNDVEGVVLKPGDSRTSEELMVRFDVGRNDGLELHAKELAKRLGFEKKKNKKPYVNLSFWSWAFGNLQVEAVRGALNKVESMEAQGVPIHLVQLDDLGAARHPHGDWVGENDDFLKEEFGGLQGFTDAVHAQGEEAGVWMAPGFVNSKAALHAEIMANGGEWYVKDSKTGEPMVEKHIWEGVTEYQYILDMTHPEVQDHMRSLLKGLKDRGVDMIKMDFLYNLITPGKRYREDLTSVEAYNEFFTIVNEVWKDEKTGEKMKINACGAPFYKTAGEWAIRGGADVLADNAPQWYNPGGKDKLSGGAAQNSVLANFTRLAVLNNMFQRIDPDSTVTRLQGDSILTPAEVKTIAASNRMGSDALITIGDDPRSIERDQINLLRLAIANGEPAKPVVFDQGFPTIAMRKNGDDQPEIYLINWGNLGEKKYVIPADILGEAAKGYVLKDVFTGNETFHPVISDHRNQKNINITLMQEQHGTEVFALTAV